MGGGTHRRVHLISHLGTASCIGVWGTIFFSSELSFIFKDFIGFDFTEPFRACTRLLFSTSREPTPALPGGGHSSRAPGRRGAGTRPPFTQPLPSEVPVVLSASVQKTRAHLGKRSGRSAPQGPPSSLRRDGSYKWRLVSTRGQQRPACLGLALLLGHLSCGERSLVLSPARCACREL